MTLNLGLCFARDNALVPPQCREAGDFAAAQCWDKIQMKIFNSNPSIDFNAANGRGSGRANFRVRIPSL